MKTVLYITYDGLTDPLGQSQILPYIIGLSKNGYSFSIISCEKPEKFESGKQQIELICKENHIEWHPLVYHKKPPIISTIQDIIQIRKKAFELHRLKNFSIIHCRSHISSMVGLEMKRKYGIPFIFDMRGFFADERVDGKLWNLSNPIFKLVYQFFKSKEAAFVQHSNAVISLTEAGKQIMLSWPGMRYSNKFTVIPCSADMALFDRSTLNEQRLNQIKTDINSNMVIGYYGSIGTWYMMDEMLDQFVSIKNKYPNAKLLIITKDKWEPMHVSMLKNKSIDDADVIIKPAERNEMPYYMAATTIGLFFIKPCFSKMASSPTKHGEMMSMGLPLIANAGIGDVDDIVNQSNSGYIIADFTKDEYDKATEAIPALLNLDPTAIRHACTKIYALENAIQKYLNVYRSIDSNRH